MTDTVPQLAPLPSTPRQPLAPLQKITPRQKAVKLNLANTEMNKQPIPLKKLVVVAELEGQTNATPVDLTTISRSAKDLTQEDDAADVLPPIASASSGGAEETTTVAKGTIIGDQEHLFWRKNLEVHIRVWELQKPVCYAAQIHATEDKRDLGVVYINKEAVDAALDSNYILNGTKSNGSSMGNNGPRFTMQMSDLKDGAEKAQLADTARLARHCEEVMKLVTKNLNITGDKTNQHHLKLAAKGGKISPYTFVSDEEHLHPSNTTMIASREFDIKPSRAQVIENFQKIQAEFSAHLDTVKNSTGDAKKSNDNAKEIHLASQTMTSPVRLEKILKRVRMRSMLKVRALHAFGVPRTTL